MSCQTLVMVVSVVMLLFIDHLVKSKRKRMLPFVSDDEFLSAFSQELDEDKVLELRAVIAKELSIPPGKIGPDDNLNEIQKLYSPTSSGEIGLSHLEDDLVLVAEDSGQKIESYPQTVRDYIELYMGYLR